MRKVLLFLCFFTFILSMMIFSQPLTVIDDLGRVVIFDTTPNRVISAAPLVTNYLVKLGVESKIVGVTDFDVFYTKAERIGYLVPLNIEKIVALNPDVVFLFGGFQASEVEKLEKVNLRAFVVNPRNFEDIFRTLKLLGVIFNLPERSREISKKLREKLLNLAKKAYQIPLDERPRVFYASMYPGSKEIWTCGQGSFLNEAIALAGGVNIASGYTGPNGWLSVDPEFVIRNDPDVILVPYFDPTSKEKVVENFKNMKIFKDLKAVKENKVFPIDGNIASTPGPDLVDLVELLYKLFHTGI